MYAIRCNLLSISLTLKGRVHVATVLAEDASRTIQVVNQRFPLPDLRHLKRVKPVFREDGKKDATVKIVLKLAEINVEDLDTKDLLIKGVETVDVPAVAPLTMDQFEQYNSLWPVVFHQSNLQKQAEVDLEMCTNVFEEHRGLLDEYDCIIFDPVSHAVVGRATSTDPKTPLDHCVMRAIEDVASKARSSSLPPSQYLCTGFHVLLRTEPCFMCAMAFVHSRIAALIFIEADGRHGSLCSTTDCKWMQACNHRYQVYRVEE